MKKFLIGCGIAVVCVLVLIGIMAVAFGPRVARWGEEIVGKAKNEFAQEQARTAALSAWPPPAHDAPATAIFPEKVGAASRSTVLDSATLAALGLTKPARQATYQTANGTIEVWAFTIANDLEKDGLLAQIRNAYENGSGSKTMVTLPSRQSLSGSSIGTNHVLMPAGWVFIFRPHTEADPFPFIDEFFRTPVPPVQPAQNAPQ